jgi:hypothetical protein
LHPFWISGDLSDPLRSLPFSSNAQKADDPDGKHKHEERQWNLTRPHDAVLF